MSKRLSKSDENSPVSSQSYQPPKKRCSIDLLQDFKVYPEEIVEQLRGYLCDSNHLPQSIFIHGSSGTGKTQIISKLLRSTVRDPVIVNCNECFNSKILFESILNGLFGHKPSSENNYSPYVKCTNALSFIDALEERDPIEADVIMIDAAEKLMKMEDNILPLFLRLKELCDLNICCVLVSTLNIDYMYPKDHLVQTIVIYWPQYNKKQISDILLDKFEDHKTYVENGLALTQATGGNDVSHLQSIIDSMDLKFFENYLQLFLNVTFRSCRDIRELIQASHVCFQKYCEPVLNGTCDMTDVQKLFRNISETLKTSMIKTYNSIDQDTNTLTSVERLITTKPQHLELPFYAKYLLIAAYLASHNDARMDRRLFMKNHGKQRKRLQEVRSKAVVSEKLTTQMGPKPFNLDRLFAIFYAIIDDKISLNSNLMSQIPSLVRLKLLTYVSGENNVMDGNARLQCTVGLDFILQMGKSVGFNVAQHLCDFL